MSIPGGAEWAPTRIHRLIRKLSTSAQTVLVETNAGEAFAKFPGSSEGEQYLALEVIGVEAARFLGLRTFDTAIVQNPHPGLVELEPGRPCKAGPVFVSRAEKGTTWSGDSDDLSLVVNPTAISGLLVLDTWLQNCDRYRQGDRVRENLGNVFISREVRTKKRGHFELVAMDHTHIITCGRTVTNRVSRIDQTRERKLYGNFPGFREHVFETDVRRFLTKLAQFQAEDAWRIISQLPREWLPGQEIRAAIVEYLVSRAAFVSLNLGTILADAGWINWQIEL